MKALYVIAIFAVTGCQESDKEPKAPVEDSAAILRLADTVSVQPDTADKSINPVKDTIPYIRAGKHSFTLHWISWDKPGSVEIIPDTAGWYAIKGGQKNAGDYITINGRLKRNDENSLLFRGEIKYAVSSINNSKPCMKEGDQIFKTTQNRKYWRLQNMLSCEGGTTDYVDIYF